MPLKDSIIRTIRKNSLRAFKMISKGKGVFECDYYPAVVGGVPIVKRNLYHDVVVDTGVNKTTAIKTYTYIDMVPPLKTVKNLGWWKEDETLPMLAYLPYEDTFVPEKGAHVVVASTEGFMGGTWIIQQVKAYGQGVSVLWVCTVVPKRDLSV